MHSLLSFFMLLCSLYSKGPYFEFTTYSQKDSARILYSAPKALSEETLLVPAFDTLDLSPQDSPKRKAYVKKVNQLAREANATLKKTLEGNYPYSYQLASLKEIESLRKNGKRYYLDLVLMPKQMHRLKPEALIPSFERHQTANKMYRNNNLQFHYYFYIRDLHTGDIYASTKPKGNPQVYKGIDKFLKQIIKDL